MMIKRYPMSIVLLACGSLMHASENTEEFSMLAERVTRSYQDMLDVGLIRAIVVRKGESHEDYQVVVTARGYYRSGSDPAGF